MTQLPIQQNKKSKKEEKKEEIKDKTQKSPNTNFEVIGRFKVYIIDNQDKT